MNHEILASLWAVADLLRGDFKQSEYGRIILPFTVLRRLDCLFDDGCPTLFSESATQNPRCRDTKHPCNASAGSDFYNSSAVGLKEFLEGGSNVQQALHLYIQQFSPSVIEIFERFDFGSQVERLEKVDLLHPVVSEFCRIDLHLAAVSHSTMASIFEQLIEKFAEISNEVAGEHFTPRDIVSLMVRIVFGGEIELAPQGSKKYSVYDPTAGTGGLLSMSDVYFEEQRPEAILDVFGQELNDEWAAVCKANMLFRRKDFRNVVIGNTLTEDRYAGRKFDYMLSNSPFGVEWRKAEKIIRQEHEKKGFDGRFGPGLPRLSDSGLLFVLNLIDKMKSPLDGGSRICTVVTGSTLRSGGVSSGESNIRKWIVEQDLLEAVIALPSNVFFNVGVSTYILVLSNKPRTAGIKLINASGLWESMRTQIGRKSRYISAEHIAKISSIYKDGGSELIKVVSKSDLLYRNFTIDVGGNLISRNVPLSKDHGDYLGLTESLGISVKAEKKPEIGCEIDFHSFFSNHEMNWASTLPLLALVEACNSDSGWDLGIKESGIIFRSSYEGSVDIKKFKLFKIKRELVLPRYLEIYISERSVKEDGASLKIPTVGGYLGIRIECPALKKQQAIVEFYGRKSEFLVRLARIEQEQWEDSANACIFNRRIGEYADGAEYLMKILPHPLASLLYKIQCENSKRDVLEAYRVFFECLGSVLSSIALGVIYESKGGKDCFDAIANRGRVTRPTMGSYQNILRRCREKSGAVPGFGNYVLSVVASHDVESALTSCTDIRNEISHRGLIKPGELGEYIDRFQRILNTLTDVLGDFFAENFIAKQLHQKWNGQVFGNEVLSLTGIASYPFERRIKDSVRPLISGELYLFQGIDEKNGAGNHIRLFHFVKCLEIVEGSDNEGFYFLNSISRSDSDLKNIFHFSSFQPLIESKKIMGSGMLDEILSHSK
jgi:type I restriction enzyme M protein